MIANGALSWLAELAGAGADAITAVEAVGGGKALVAGHFSGAPALTTSGCTPLLLSSAGAADGFVAELDPSGCVSWHHRLGGPGADRIAALSRAGDGAIVVGQFALTLEDGTMELLATTLVDDGFLARVSPLGVDWARRFGAASCSPGSCAIAADPAIERRVFAGSYSGTVIMRGPLASAGGLDGFVAALAP